MNKDNLRPVTSIKHDDKRAAIPDSAHQSRSGEPSPDLSIENLKEATGVIDCPQAKRLARRLKQECADFARLSQDMVFDNLTHRAGHCFPKGLSAVCRQRHALGKDHRDVLPLEPLLRPVSEDEILGRHDTQCRERRHHLETRSAESAGLPA